jgi:hypothetical protein
VKNRKQRRISSAKKAKTSLPFILFTVFAGIFLATSGIFASLSVPDWHNIGAIWSLFLFFVCSGIALCIQLVEIKRGNSMAAIWGGIVIFLGLGLCLFLQKTENNQEDFLSGVITPASDPLPPLPREIRPEDAQHFMLLFLGNSVSLPMWFPHTVIKYGAKDILTISTNSSGLTISCELFGENGNIVAMIETNKFTINPLNYFRRERPDRHTLIIYDQQNVQVLNVRYLNPKAIKITGRIRILNGPTIEIADDHLRQGNMEMSQAFFGATMNDIVIPAPNPN